MKTLAPMSAFLCFNLLVVHAAQAADDAASEARIEAVIEYPSVAAALEALRTDPAAQLESQAGWIVVASSERGNPVLWSFTPEGHPAHPAVVKRTALEKKGTGFVELATLCQGPEAACVELLDEFRQIAQQVAQSNLAKRVVLDVGIAQNDHDRVLVRHLLAEEGKAAEIRMDGLLKVVIVPSWDELRGVMLWTAMYEFDGRDFRLAARPTIAAPGSGTAEIDVPALSGDTFRFSITPLLAAARTGL
jgi:hypothetical protein